MKTKMLFSLFTGAAVLSGGGRLAAQTVDFSALPAAVQETINAQRGPAGIASVERVYRSGMPVYKVHLDRGGPNDLFYVMETGGLADVSSRINSQALLDQTREVVFNALPPAVQSTIRSQFGGQAIPPIEMFTANGQTSYRLPARVDDRVVDMWIDPKGQILALSPPRVLLSNGVRVNPGEMPTAVQDTIRTYAEGAPIDRVTKGTVRGQTVYDALVRRNGGNIDLRVGQDGALVRDTINDRYLAQTGRMTREGLVANAPTRVPLTDPAPLSFNQLPMPVLSTLQTYAGADFIENIEHGYVQGQPVFEAVFRHAGQDVPLRIAQDGSLIHDQVNDQYLAQYGSILGTALGQAPAVQSGVGTGTSR